METLRIRIKIDIKERREKIPSGWRKKGKKKRREKKVSAMAMLLSSRDVEEEKAISVTKARKK